MKRCERCGLAVEFRDAKFCPMCGGRLFTVIPKLDVEKRFLVALAALMLAVMVTLFGVMEHVPVSEAKSVEERYRGFDEFLRVGGLQYIFGNNVIICLFTFIPFFGPLDCFYALYRTGWVIAALSTVSGLNPLMIYIRLWMGYVHTWLEYGAVSLALSESLILSYYILRYGWRGLRMEARNVPLILTVCVVLLFLAAAAEVASIITGY